MIIVELIDYLRDRMPSVIKACYVVLGALVVIDLLFVD